MRLEAFERIKTRALFKMAHRAMQFFKQRHEEGGFTNRVFKQWARKRNGSPSFLKKTGALQRNTMIGQVNADQASIINNTDYAQAHNEGIGQAKRQFIGNSDKLEQELKKILEKEILQSIDETIFRHSGSTSGHRQF